MKLSQALSIAEQVASEDSERDLKFSGDAALARLPVTPEQRAELRVALKFYATSAASRAVRHLALVHGAFEKNL